MKNEKEMHRRRKVERDEMDDLGRESITRIGKRFRFQSLFKSVIYKRRQRN